MCYGIALKGFQSANNRVFNSEMSKYSLTHSRYDVSIR